MVSVTWKQGLVAVVLIGLILIGVSSDTTEIRKVSEMNWKDLDLTKNALPDDLESKRNLVEISENSITVDGAKIFYQSASPVGESSGKSVLLLHGAAFTSQTWVDKVPTIATLAALGHSVIAVDLPGYGKSRGENVGNKGEFLKNMIIQLFGATKLKVVVVTPSMSGSFFIPMLEDAESRDLIAGWVPVAPVGTSRPNGFYSSIQIPTMIVYGENDRGLGHSSRDDLVELPNSTKPQVLPGAGHPAYLDQPELWHTLLYNFISNIQA